MEMDLLMTYLVSSLKRLNADVEKLRSNQYNSDDVLDHLSSELIMLQNHVYYFGQMQEKGLFASQMDDQARGLTGCQMGPTGGQMGPTGVPMGSTGAGPTGGPTGAGPTGGETGGPTGGETGGATGGEQPGEIPEPEPLTYFTPEQLSQYDGRNGAPAYVAVNGVVYNVTNNRLWSGGNHFWGLSAGRDLSVEFASCHPGAMVLSVLPVVGYMIQEQGEQ